MPEPLSTSERRELDRWLDRALDLEGAELTALIREVPERIRERLVRLLEDETEASPLDAGLPKTLLESVIEETSTEMLPPGTRIGPWEVVATLGRGGMGEVYRARRADGAFERQVALKVATVRHRDDERRLRLESERRILAGLSHPAIAGLLDGGVTVGGRPWFAMELIDGEPLLEACDRRRLGIERRLDLFAKVAGAIEAAHRRAVVHRDLKPSNVLVTSELEVKLLDFGIAGVLGADGAAAEATSWLSPDHASPEMLRGEPVGAPSDIYQLGVLLYQLVMGVVPADLGARERSEWLDYASRAPAPVARWRELDRPARAALAAARATSSAQLERHLAGDLGAILARATAFEIDRRYETVGLMLDDVERWRMGLPVRAVGDGLGYRLRRFVGRHRLAVLTSAAALVVAATFVVATGIRLAEQERAARVQAERAGAVAAFMGDLFRAGDPLRRGGPEPRVRDLLDRGAERLERELGTTPEVRDSMRVVLGQAYLGLGDTAAARPLLEQALAGRSERLGADAPELAEVWLGLAEAARIERRHADAEHALHSARRLVRDAELETRIGLERARLARDRGRHGEGLALIAAARGLLHPRGASSLVYEIEAVEGSIYFDQGRHREAAGHLERAASAARGDAAMEAQLATALGLLAGSELYLGRPVRARAALEEAAGLWDHTVGSHHPEALLARANLAAVYAEVGETGRALELAAQVEAAAAAAGDRVALARAEVARGLAHLAEPGLDPAARSAAVAAVTHGGAILASRFGSAATARIWADLGDQLWQSGEQAEALTWWRRAWQAAEWPAEDTRSVDLGWREIRARLGAGDREAAEQLLARLETAAEPVVLEGTLAWAQLLVLRAELERDRGGARSAEVVKRLQAGLEAVEENDPRGAAMVARDLETLRGTAAAR